MISYLGEGLNITISCNYVPGHSWMAYICWYSIKQNLPDAKVNIICSRENITGRLFLWTKSLNIPFLTYNSNNFKEIISRQIAPTLVCYPECVVVRDFEESSVDLSFFDDNILFLQDTDLFCDANSDDFHPFCSYKDGWGYFVTNDWINKEECPLSNLLLKKFSKKIMSINEKKIENLWNSSLRLFQAVSGGVIK